MKIQNVLLVLLTIFIVSCKSVPKDDAKSIYIMVYDYNSTGIKDVTVYINEKEIGKTDVYGRLIFPLVRFESENKIELKKTGYEKLSKTTAFQNDNVFYFKMGTSSYYAKKAEEKFDEGFITEALDFIEKALAIEYRKDYEYLKNVILKEKNK